MPNRWPKDRFSGWIVWFAKPPYGFSAVDPRTFMPGPAFGMNCANGLTGAGAGGAAGVTN